MSSRKVAKIIWDWNKGDANQLPEKEKMKIINLWNVIEIKKGMGYIWEVFEHLENIKREEAGA